jgi:hypothetical protein
MSNHAFPPVSPVVDTQTAPAGPALGQTPKGISDTALAAAYQVTARSFANQAQAIWRAISLFVTFNALVVALLGFIREMHPFIRIVLPLLGVGFAIAWYFAMKRLWFYHDAYIHMARDQEAALSLNSLGMFSRAYTVCEGGHGQVFGGVYIQFTATLRLRYLFNSIICLFGIVYLLFLIDALRRVVLQ